MVEQIVVAIIGLVCGNIMTLVFWPQRKRQEELKTEEKVIDNEVKLVDEWHKLYEETQEINKALNKKVDNLHEQITKHRDNNANLQVQITELSIDIARLKVLKCERPACASRTPPTGY